jgi:hypothetical protein
MKIVYYTLVIATYLKVDLLHTLEFNSQDQKLHLTGLVNLTDKEVRDIGHAEAPVGWIFECHVNVA